MFVVKEVGTETPLEGGMQAPTLLFQLIDIKPQLLNRLSQDISVLAGNIKGRCAV